MSQSSPLLSAHRIGVLMSPAGRFLKCKDCLLCFDFPDGERYNAVASAFRTPSLRFSSSESFKCRNRALLGLP